MSLSACPACGESAVEGARYCRLCGAALRPADHLSADHLAADHLPADHSPGPSSGSASSGSVHRDAPSRWWLAGAALLVVLGAGWAVVRSADPSRATEGAAPSTTDDTTGDSTGDSTAASTAADGSDTADGDGTGGPTSGPQVVQEGSGPVLDRPVGWSVLVGERYNPGGGLWRLDLDTGRLVRYPKVQGAPLAVAGSRLLLIDDDVEDGTAALSAVSLDDPGQPPVPADGPANVAPFSVRPAGPGEGAGDGAVWIFDYGPGPARWVLVDLTTGAAIDEVAVGEGFSFAAVWGAGPELATSGSGGLFRRDGGGYRLVAPGRTVAAVDGDVLVQTCSSPMDCRMDWIDSGTGQTVDHPVPPPDGGAQRWLGLVPGSDRFLNGMRVQRLSEPPQVVLFDVATGRLIEPGPAAVRGVTASPDGRLLLTSGLGDTGEVQVAIYDVESGRSYPLAGSPPVANLQAVFVPNG